MSFYPVAGSLVVVEWEGGPVGFAQSVNVVDDNKYTPAQRLGFVYPAVYVIAFATVAGSLQMAETGGNVGSQNFIQYALEQVRNDKAQVGPGDVTLSYRSTAGGGTITDTVEHVKLSKVQTSVNIDGQLMTTAISFFGIRNTEL